uniref:Uncharacterized protein n=1 Tax=Anguilla anguilla TaxID=7936 RepID=A0A0E9Q1I7_ANGAN
MPKITRCGCSVCRQLIDKQSEHLKFTFK